ncbi:MAG: histidinol-phosphatase HisJ family protein [Clostridia bacterium]|nr:histidinol-phosphatase HisJ family protein [Clostridia bacterium]
MEYKNLLDMHIHTANSFDGHHSAMRMCEAAVKKGIRSVTFTDHCETDIFRQGNFQTAMTHSIVEAAKAKSAFTGTLLVNIGIELGQPCYDVETAEKIISGYEYDQIIGSVHNLRGEKDFYFIEDYKKINIEDTLNEYFDEILTMINWGNFDVLAHLDYPLRYAVGEQKVDVDMAKFSKKTDEILSLLVEKEISLEINTSGLRQAIGRTLPGVEILKRFRELGGSMITVGSDAHLEDHVGAGVEEAMTLAKECGFSCITLYQQRMPVQIPIK